MTPSEALRALRSPTLDLGASVLLYAHWFPGVYDPLDLARETGATYIDVRASVAWLTVNGLLEGAYPLRLTRDGATVAAALTVDVGLMLRRGAA